MPRTDARGRPRPTSAADGRRRLAYDLAVVVLARRHRQEVGEVRSRLLAGETVDGVSLQSYLHRVAVRRRERQRPRTSR